MSVVTLARRGRVASAESGCGAVGEWHAVRIGWYHWEAGDGLSAAVIAYLSNLVSLIQETDQWYAGRTARVIRLEI